MVTKKNEAKSTSATEVVKPEVLKGMSDATFNGLVNLTEAITSATATGDSEITTAKWSKFSASVEALSTLGKRLLSKSIAGNLTGAVNGVTIHKSFADKNSANFRSTRKGLPSETVCVRAVQIATDDTAKRRRDFETEGNRPDVQDYIPFILLSAGKSLANGSRVNVSKSKVNGKVSKIVRDPSSRSGKSSKSKDSSDALPEFKLELATDDELSKVPEVLNIEGVVMSKRLDLARQLIASVLIHDRSEKVSDALHPELITR